MDNQWNTNDGNPPMSLASGGTNAPGLAPGMTTITVPSQILQHPAVQQAVQQAAQDLSPDQMAQQASQMPTGDDYAQKLINNMKAIKASGVFDTPYQKNTAQHPVLAGLANAMMAFGQGLTKQPFYSDFQNNQAALQKASMDMITSSLNRNQQVPLIQIGTDGTPQVIGNTVKGSIVKQAPASVLAPEQVNNMAQQLVDREPGSAYGKLVPSQLNGMRGVSKAQILAQAQELDPSFNPAKADMEYAVNKMGAGQFEKNYNALDSFHKDFEKNADYLLKLSPQVDRSKYPIINQAIIAGKQNIAGDPVATKFIQTINTVANGYARLQNPTLSGQPLSDAARSEARDLANKFMSGEQVDALFNPEYGSMRIEANNRIAAAQEVRDRLKGQTSSSSGQSDSNNSQKIGRFQVQVH